MQGDELFVHGGPARVNPISGCLTARSKVIAMQYFILVSFSVSSY